MRLPHPLIDRHTLEKLERLSLRWQGSFTGMFGGHNPSRQPGPGQEFLDHRQFHQGDDLRSVNWLAYMRLERLFLKMFRVEPRVPVRIFLDTSESMACGWSQGRGEPKFVYACRLAAMLCYVGLVRLDTIELQPFGERLAESYKAQGGRHRFAPALHFLAGLETGGRSSFQAVVRQFLSSKPALGLILMVSDFLDEQPGGCERALEQLADFGHEVMLVHVAGPDDASPPWRSEVELVDAETGEVRWMELDQSAADHYISAYGEFCEGLERTAARHGGRYVALTTDSPVEEAIFGPLVETGRIGLR